MFQAKEFVSIEELNTYLKENENDQPRSTAYSNNFRNVGNILVVFETSVVSSEAPTKKPLRKG